MSRALLACRTLYGAGLLLAPSAILARLARMPLDREAMAVARVLGARYLLQAALVRTRATRRQLLVGAGVDTAHAASMAGVARWSPRPAHRALAAHQARSAALLAVAGVAASRR